MYSVRNWCLRRCLFSYCVSVGAAKPARGIVGEWKYTYDIWGDAVNVAARMESSGLANRINISESTYRLVRYFFECKSRAQIAAKHKGELKMYKVRRIKKELSVDGLGLIPNELFLMRYQALRGHASH